VLGAGLAMIEGARVVVVIPARDEAARIGHVIATLPPEVDRAFVVDDASRDATCSAARAVIDPRVTLLTHGTNRGVGAAIVTGYRAALAEGGDARDAFVVMAGDAQMDPCDLPALAGPIARGAAGYVKGNRFAHPEVRRVMPRARYAGGLVFSRLTSIAIGQRVTDSQCGYTAIAREACARLDLDALWPRYGYPNDLLAMLVARGVTIAEACVRPVYAGEASGLRAWHCARIAQLCARAYARRVLSA
jgi:glycosyltransferase involved in cell wall biosynthesis